MVKRIPPKPGQESVWDYPRPPRLEKTPKRIQIMFGGVMIADSLNAYRLLETSHPPAYYVPTADVQMQYLTASNHRTFCEFKGAAAYYTIHVGDTVAESAAWHYPNVSGTYAPLRNHIAVYPALMEACYVNGELAQPQEGGFYGGWITSDIVGPFKGGAGTWGW